MMLLLLAISVLVMGCDYYYEPPYEKGSRWACEEPQVMLSYTKDAEGNLLQEEILVWNEQTMEIDVVFQSSQYVAYPENAAHYDHRLFSGSWTYKNGSLILVVEEDFLFHNQFDHLVFALQSEE